MANYLSIVLLCFSTFFQVTAKTPDHFNDDRIAFDYLRGWIVTDESTETALRLSVWRNGDRNQIMIVVSRGIVRRVEIDDARKKFTDPLIDEVALKIDPSGKSLERVAIKTEIAGQTIEGTRLQDATKKKPIVADVYAFRYRLRWINLVLIRDAKLSPAQIRIWKAVTSSFSVKIPVLAAMKVSAPGSMNGYGDNLNGRALTLPLVAYPPVARAAHASGKVVVQVVVDENGNVESAAALSGHPLLQPVCIAAAKKARFAPVTYDGEPVKVKGVISYNFLAQ